MVNKAGAPFRGRRVLITGGAGFIGRCLAVRLVASGAVVSAADSSAAGLRLLQSRCPEVRPHELDVRDEEAVKHVVLESRPQYVFHLAAAGVSDPFLSLDLALAVNLHGSVNLLRACFEPRSRRETDVVADGVIRLVHTSTPYENGRGADNEPCPISHYAASKAAASAVARMFCATRGWPIVLVRPFQVYGPGQPTQALIPSAIMAARAGRPFRMTGGEQERDFVFVDDVVRGYMAAAAGGVDGRCYDLGWGRTHAVRTVIERLYKLIKARTQPLFGALPYRPGEVWSTRADSEPATRDLGWYPWVSLDEGLALAAANVLGDSIVADL